MTMVRCPNCDATYKVDPTKLAAGGRKLKCAQCQTVWLATAEAEPVAVPESLDSFETNAPTEVPAPEEGSASPDDAPAEGDVTFAPTSEEMIVQRNPGVEVVTKVGGWRQAVRGDNVWRSSAVLLAVAGLIAGAVSLWLTLRDTADVPVETPAAVELVEPPPSREVVQPPKGVVLHRVRGEVTEMKGDKGGVALTVRGLLTNTTSVTISIPQLQLELLGADGKVADMWPVSGVDATLEPQAEQAWTVSLTAPDMTVIQGWRVVFVKPLQD